jgi:hypothetical protein
MSVFTHLPQDMLQFEINRFLDPLSRAEFNGVLKADEHVFKKLPTDYALSHEIEVKRKQYQSMSLRLSYYINLVDYDYEIGKKRALIKAEILKKIWEFLRNPLNALIFAHTKGLKEKMIRMVGDWAADDIDFYDYLPDHGLELRTLAEHTCAVIALLPFTHEVKIVKSIF